MNECSKKPRQTPADDVVADASEKNSKTKTEMINCSLKNETQISLVRFGLFQPQFKSTPVDGPIKMVISDRDNFNINEVKLQMNESRSDRMWSGMDIAEMKKCPK